jgi:DNA-binding transcriptional LysR family regulator
MITYKRDSPIFAALAKHGYGPVLDAASMEVGSSLIACGAVDRGFGLALVDRETVAHERFRNVVMVPTEAPISIAVLAYFRAEAVQSSAAKRVLESLVEEERS